MPSGPKKRSAARRRSIGASGGKRLSLDLESVSGSHASDEGGTSPKTSDRANRRLSVSTGTSERPGDQTSFHTEEWVRVSDFDVGTPTSTTAKSDNDAAAEDSYSEVRAQDKLADWETVSRENAGNSSSAEDVGEAENVVVEDSSGSGHDHGQKHADKVISDSSDKEDDDAKSVSSRSDRGKSSHSSSSSSSSSSTVRSSAAFPKKSDDEERSSSTVVVLPHEDESRESSYAEVTSVEACDDDYRIANFPSPGSKGVQSSAIEPVSSSDEQEGENDESFAGVENQDMSCTLEPVSSEEEEEGEKYRLFSDASNVKNLLEQEEASGDFPSPYDSYASFLASRIYESESETHDTSEVTDAKTETPGFLEEEHPTRGRLEMEEQQVPEAKEVGPEVKGTEPQVVEGVRPEILASDQNLQAGGNTGEELAESIEPTTPEKASEKSGSENPYTFERSISDEELVFEPEYSSPSEGKQEAAQDSSEKSPEVQDVDASIAKEFQDAPSSSSGVPEPDQHELNQLLEIAHSKEIAKLGKQEEKLVAQEEQDLGKGIVVEPLVEVLSATDDPKPLEGGEVKDLQPVVAEEAPLLKDSPTPVVSEFQIEAELKEKAPELFSKESEDELHETEVAGKERQILEGKLSKGDSSSSSLSSSSSSSSSSSPSSSSPLDHVLQFNELPTKTEDVTLVPLSSIPDSEIPKSSAGVTKNVGVTSLADDIEESRELSRSSEKSEQVAIAPHRKIEEQGRPSRTSSEIGGCCEPVQWLFGNFTRLFSPRSVRN